MRGVLDWIKERGEKAVYFIIGACVLLLIFAVYMTFFFTQECANFDCFQEKMQKCERGITYINDDKEATWRYEIIGSPDDGTCNVEVKILQAKEGELEIDKLKGFSMNCYYPMGVGTYPEQNLDKCHGRLKEELQSLIIKRLHAYLIENLGKVEEGLEGI